MALRGLGDQLSKCARWLPGAGVGAVEVPAGGGQGCPPHPQVRHVATPGVCVCVCECVCV